MNNLFENRMAVEGQREYEERYGGPDYVTYCEVYKCKDCPRYGDDCDGRDEEDDDDDIAYYEKQGDEYVYYDANEHELFREPI